MLPVLRLLNESQAVHRLYQKFHNLLVDGANFPQQLALPLRSRGGPAATHVRYAPKLGMWASPGNLSWNAFGRQQDPQMVVQLNFPDYDQLVPRRVGAAFVTDEWGRVLLVHRGHMGGGKAGVSLASLFATCTADQAQLQEADGTFSPCFVVGQLQSKLFLRQLAAFVEAVYQAKQNLAAPGLQGISPTLLSFDSQLFQPERTGQVTRQATEQVTFTHALVVNELQRQLASLRPAPRWSLRNDRHRDLLLLDGSRAKALFEVKSAVTTQTLCTGLGQLLLYSSPLPNVRRVLVLPDKLAPELTACLTQYQIHVLYYKLSATTVVFKDLAKFAGSQLPL